MRSKKLLAVLFFLAMFTMAFNLVGALYDSVFYNIEDVPKGVLVAEYDSPTGEQKISCYKVETAIGNAVRCSLTDDEGERNIYWNTETENAEIRWMNEKTVIINGMLIEIDSVVYDSRGGVYDERLF